MTFASTRVMLTAVLCLLGMPLSMAPALADTTKSTRSAQPQVSKQLRQKYAAYQSKLLQEGRLRTDAASLPADSMTREALERDFLDIAMRDEYGSGGLSAGNGARSDKPLLRWEDPVRLQVMFGASIAPSQKAADLRTIDDYIDRLSGATGHPVSMSHAQANFFVLVVNEAERRGLAKQLPKLIPGIHPGVVKTVARMQPNHLCMVVAEPHADRREGYRMAVAIVRAEHTGRMRESCIQEELAQGMGLPNDCPWAHPSIFNDDEEFAVLTRRDEKLLKMLYSPQLRSGMTRAEAEPVVTRLAAGLSGN